MEFHPIANVFPLLEGDEFRELCADIEKNGQQQPILTYEGKILDGRNRFRACLEVSEEPWTEPWYGSNPVEAVLSLNLHRRHLTSGQKAAIGVEVEKVLAEQATQRLGGRPKKTEKPTERIPGVSELPDNGKAENLTQKVEQVSGEAREQAAKLTGTNPRYISDAKKLAAVDPEAFESVRKGETTLPKAMEPHRRPLKNESQGTVREALEDADVQLPPWNPPPEQKMFRGVVKNLVALTRLDPEKVASYCEGEQDANRREGESEAIRDWFERYEVALRKKRRELRPGNLRAVGGNDE